VILTEYIEDALFYLLLAMMKLFVEWLVYEVEDEVKLEVNVVEL
jgi:hypothetical protein